MIRPETLDHHAVAHPVPTSEPEDISLIQRFADAAEPGDWSALAIGLALGVLLDSVFVIAAYWDAILTFVGAN